MRSNRIEYIDLAKGICILLVVVHHSLAFEGKEIFVYLRMPFYFFISGLFFKDYGALPNLVVKKTNKLLIPFVFFYSFTWIAHIFCNIVKPGFWSYDRNVILDIIGMSYINFPIWFLLCLFWCNVTYYFIYSYCKKQTRILVIISFAVLSCLLMKANFFCPTYFFQSFSALPFFYVGNELRSSKIIESECNSMQVVIAFLLIALVVLLHYISSDNIIYVYNYYQGNLLLYYLKSFMMIIAIVLICKKIKRLPIVSFCGRYSIIILGIHAVFIQIAYHIPNWIGHNSCDEIIQFAFVLIMSITSIPIFINLFPYFTAQKDLIKIK